MKKERKNDDRHEPRKKRGVLPGTSAGEPDLGDGILPGTPAEKREDDLSRAKE